MNHEKGLTLQNFVEENKRIIQFGAVSLAAGAATFIGAESASAHYATLSDVINCSDGLGGHDEATINFTSFGDVPAGSEVTVTGGGVAKPHTVAPGETDFSIGVQLLKGDYTLVAHWPTNNTQAFENIHIVDCIVTPPTSSTTTTPETTTTTKPAETTTTTTEVASTTTTTEVPSTTPKSTTTTTTEVPSTTTTVVPTTTPSVTTTTEVPPAPRIPQTGGDVAPLAGSALGLIAAGAVVVRWIKGSRRRQLRRPA